MKKYLLFAFCFAALAGARAQFVNDINGTPVRARDYTNVEGNPFLTEAWVEGTVKLKSGKTISKVPLKLDMVEDMLYFKDTKGNVLQFVEPVAEFKLPFSADGQLTESLYRAELSPETNGNAFYRVLFDGSADLLKQDRKRVVETKAYNSATGTKTFSEVTGYYVLRDNKITKLKKDKKSVISALSDKGAKVEEYIKSNNLDVKNDADLIAVFKFYNEAL
jgi:hypothetical protein